MQSPVTLIESPFTTEQLEMLNAPLDQKRVKHRPGGGGTSLAYLEGFDVIQAANRILGPGNWGFDIISNELNHITDEKGLIIASYYAARVTLTVKGCVPITEEGTCGVAEGRNIPAKIQGHETGRKGAITDALKRALRCYGNQFGLSLYDTDLVDGQARTQGNQAGRGGQSSYTYNSSNSGYNNNGGSSRPAGSSTSSGSSQGSRPTSTPVPAARPAPAAPMSSAPTSTTNSRNQTANVPDAGAGAGNESYNRAAVVVRPPAAPVPASQSFESPTLATEQQHVGITRLAGRLHLGSQELANKIQALYDKPISKLTQIEAKELITTLNASVSQVQAHY